MSVLLYSLLPVIPRCMYIAVRIVNPIRSLMPDYGQIQIHDGDQWNPVCDKFFDDKDAGVLCRNLDFVYGKSLCCSAFSNIERQRPLPMWKLECSGREESHLNCSRSLIQSDTCGDGHTGGILCSNDTSGGKFKHNEHHYPSFSCQLNNNAFQYRIN